MELRERSHVLVWGIDYSHHQTEKLIVRGVFFGLLGHGFVYHPGSRDEDQLVLVGIYPSQASEPGELRAGGDDFSPQPLAPAWFGRPSASVTDESGRPVHEFAKVAPGYLHGTERGQQAQALAPIRFCRWNRKFLDDGQLNELFFDSRQSLSLLMCFWKMTGFLRLVNRSTEPYFRKMRIAIDARMMGPENTRGIGRYIEELVRSMLEQGPENYYVLIVRKPDHPFKDEPNVETVIADVPWYGLAEQLKMPAILRGIRADFVHVPHWNVPLLYRGPLVVTIHDLLLRHFPLSAKTSTRSWPTRLMKRLLYRLVLADAIGRASRILVPTGFVNNDIISFYPSAQGKIVVTGEGMPEIRSMKGQDIAVPPYLLYVGSAYPHKGLEDLLAVWPKVVDNHPELRLLLVGELDIFMRRLKADASERNISNIDFLGRVSDERLSELYSGAKAFVFPSYFEGFGLPPLEALSHGCPVISSDAACMPEVLGKNGATYFRAGDSSGILLAVEKVLADTEKAKLAARQAAQGLVRRHSWLKTAQLTLLAYREIFGNHNL